MLLEQAHAITFEVYSKATQDRYIKALRLYGGGLQRMRNLPQAERVEWMLCHGVAHHKLLDLLFGSRDNQLIRDTYSGALRVFHEACQLASGLDSESMCWSYLGLICSKPPRNHENIDQDFITRHQLTPEFCFDRSLALKPVNKEAACRYAGYVLRKHRRSTQNLQKVLEFLNTVVLNRPPDLNWFVYCRRANVLLALYEAERPRNRAYLHQALQDYDQVPQDLRKDNDSRNIAKIRQYLAQ